MTPREISSLQHPMVKHLVRVREERKYREGSGSVLIAGSKLVAELSHLFPLKTVLLAAPRRPTQEPPAEQTFIVSLEILKKVTGVQAPEPIAAEISLPPPSDLIGKKKLLVLDGIADPGNLGTLWRTALALGWEGVFLTPHTTDPFNAKALRSAKGATFKMPYREGSYQELEELLVKNGMLVLVGDMRGKDVESLLLPEAYALVLGHESQGVSSALKGRGQGVAIPLSTQVESLNVAAAGAILMYRLRRRNV